MEFQNFDKEVASLPGVYARPRGCVLLAESDSGESLGVVAMRGLDKNTCEMKRMFVANAARNLGVGRALTQAIIQVALQTGYESMRLDTVERLTAAIHLYNLIGFERIGQYCENPLKDAVFMELSLPTLAIAENKSVELM